MYEIINQIGMLFLVFLLTINLMAAFVLLHQAGTYFRDRNRREEADARMRMANVGSHRVFS